MDLFQMDFFIYILILMLAVGAFFIIYGSIASREAKVAPHDEGDGHELLSLEQKLDTLETSVYEADEAVNMLGDMSKNVFKEFDSKYQELLFLYNLVDEKQKTLTLTGDTNAVARHRMNAKTDPVVVSDILVHDGGFSDTGTPAPKQKAAKVKKKAATAPRVFEGGEVTSLDITVDDSTDNQNFGINPKFAHVLQLSQDGKSVEDIARELNMGKGEIMLILNLGGRRQNA